MNIPSPSRLVSMIGRKGLGLQVLLVPGLDNSMESHSMGSKHSLRDRQAL